MKFTTEQQRNAERRMPDATWKQMMSLRTELAMANRALFKARYLKIGVEEATRV